jgi:hypothetical protein
VVALLFQSCAYFYLFGEAGEDWAAFWAYAGGYDHAVGLYAA